MSDVRTLVQKEPWRLGAGQPKNALDPTWNTDKTTRCNGDIAYEDGTNWWVCQKCGCCGNHDFAKAHRPINDPGVFFVESVANYVAQREQEGVSRELASKQLLHIAAVAIRYAASVKADEINGYIERLVR